MPLTKGLLFSVFLTISEIPTQELLQQELRAVSARLIVQADDFIPVRDLLKQHAKSHKAGLDSLLDVLQLYLVSAAHQIINFRNLRAASLRHHCRLLW